MNSTKWLTTVVAIQAAMIIGLWFGPRAQPAQADIPDAAGQLVQLNQSATASNEKLDKIVSLLQEGKLEVHVVKSDDDSGK
jgi:hypothetical protein